MKMNTATILVKTIIRLVLAAFFIAYFYNIPYNYDQMLRALALVSFTAICYLDWKKEYNKSIFISVAGIILFNPFYMLPFGDDTWDLVSEAGVFALIAWSIFEWVYWFNQNRKKNSRQFKNMELTFDHAYYL